MPNKAGYMTVPELMDWQDISLSTVHAWKRAGMPYFQAVPNGRLLFNQAAVKTWIEAHKGASK